MKTLSLNIFLSLVAIATSLTTALSGTANAAQQTETASQWVNVSTTELPAQAALQVVNAQADDRADVTRSVVATAMVQKKALAPALVGAIAKSSPEMAAIAAVTAVQQDPKQIGEITVAAVSAAHTQAGKIVAAICQKFPAKFNLIAMAAYQAAPEAGKEILAAVASSVPVLRPFIAQASSSSVPMVIAETQSQLYSSARALGITPDSFLAGQKSGGAATSVTLSGTPSYIPLGPGPIIGGAYTPPTGAPKVISPGDTRVVPPGGGRDYSL